MTVRTDILACLSGKAEKPLLYLPDLTLWYDYHLSKGALPDRWKDYTLPQIARSIGLPAWLVVRPWRIETPGLEVTTTENDQERTIRTETSVGTLVARWVVGPDGQWWQTEYPVKTEADLPAALELARARSYVVDVGELDRWEAEVGDDGIVAIEIPRRPYSDLLHEFLGWSEGLLLLNEPAIPEILASLEAELQKLVPELARLSGPVYFALDNLDGQFISPAVFQEQMVGSYRTTVQALHRYDKHLIIHIGGPIKRILADLAATGIDGVEGVAGPPQSDMTLTEARQAAGPGLTLWGGIPQDFVLDARDRQSFQTAVTEAVRQARQAGPAILGVADRVPVEAEMDRIEAIAALIEQA